MEHIEKKYPSFYDCGIEELLIGDNVRRCLKREQIFTIRDLCSKSATELFRIRGIGIKSLVEIVKEVERIGYRLKHDRLLNTILESFILESLRG